MKTTRMLGWALYSFISGILCLSVSEARNLEIYCVWGNDGAGTCTVVKGPNGAVVLLDETGGNTEANALYNDILQPNGISYINYAVACHYDSDHIGGLDDLVSLMGGAGTFGTFYDRGGTLTYDGGAIPSAYYNLVNPSGKRRTVTLDGASDIDLGNGAIIRFLSVGAPNTEKALHIRGRPDVTSGISENNKSISSLVTYGGFDFYFGSDLEGTGETAVAGVVTQDIGRELDVLHVDHHGSDANGINSLSFFQTMGPDVAVISVWSNSFGHPRKTTVERLQQAVERLPQRIIRLAPGDVGDPYWAPEDMNYCLTTNRHLTITTDGVAYTVGTVARPGGRDITEPGLTGHHTQSPMPTPAPSNLPLVLGTNETTFGSTGTISISANVRATSNFTPYIRFATPAGGYLYIAHGGAVTGKTTPYLKGPVSLGSNIAGYPVANINFSGVEAGGYTLQGALVGGSGIIDGINETALIVR